MPLAPNAIYKGLFREKKKVLPIKRPVHWSELMMKGCLFSYFHAICGVSYEQRRGANAVLGT